MDLVQVTTQLAAVQLGIKMPRVGTIPRRNISSEFGLTVSSLDVS